MGTAILLFNEMFCQIFFSNQNNGRYFPIDKKYTYTHINMSIRTMYVSMIIIILMKCQFIYIFYRIVFRHLLLWKYFWEKKDEKKKKYDTLDLTRRNCHF